MSKLPILTGLELIKILERMGFKKDILKKS